MDETATTTTASPTSTAEDLVPSAMEPEDGTEIVTDTDKSSARTKDHEPSATDAADIAAAATPDNKVDAASSAAAILSRPAKRARTAYFLFAEDKRKEVQEQHPGQGVAAIAKGLGVLWSQLTDDEKKVYQDKAQQEKERLVEELQAWKDAGGELVEEELFPNATNSNNGGLIFPAARIRKICKLDPEVRGLSKEALLLVTKAAEVFTSKIGTETMRVASIQNRRKLQAGDVAQVCASREQFLFLREDLADLTRVQQKEAHEKSAAARTSGDNAASTKPPLFTGKPLTSYFGAKSK